jgi:hypothetical protein
MTRRASKDGEVTDKSWIAGSSPAMTKEQQLMRGFPIVA